MSQIKVELQETMGSDRSIAEAAWTSSTTLQGKEKRSEEDVARLVDRLAKEGHAVPFETVVFRFWIRLPVAADRQLMTTRIASHSGMSGRYRTMPEEYLAIPEDVQVITQNLNAYAINDIEYAYVDICDKANMHYQEFIKTAKEAEKAGYITNLEFKRLREFYRGMLPQHNMTERVTTINLRSFANFIRLRDSDHAQPEIREVAKLMLEEVKRSNICPVAIAAIETQGWRI